MILDIDNYVASSRKHWEELAACLDTMDSSAFSSLGVEGAQHLHDLYVRAALDFEKLKSNSASPEILAYLEDLLARAYGAIYYTRGMPAFSLRKWVLHSIPCCFRRHLGAFLLSLVFTIAGMLAGAFFLDSFPQAKADMLEGFGHLHGSPSERVLKEEQKAGRGMGLGDETVFAASLMTHNTSVSVLAAALGATFGIGTFILLFFNGVVMGVISLDYIMAGQLRFLLGWLLPHGVIEIPCIMIAGQAGFVLASALIGHGDSSPLDRRIRECMRDFCTLVCTAGFFLIWAGCVEAFFSQYHEPVIPYNAK